MNDEQLQEETRQPIWTAVTGAILGTLTLLFFMALVILAIWGYVVPCGSRIHVVMVLALGASLSSSFMGSKAAASGTIPLPYVQANPLKFSVVGGVAVLLILITVGSYLYVIPCENVPVVKVVVVEGKVADKNGLPVEGARLSIDHYYFHAKTDPRGAYSSTLELPSQDESITLRAFHPEYITDKQNLTVSHDMRKITVPPFELRGR